jgi:energy-coupling factor transporter ATP-binding protein EcfA2
MISFNIVKDINNQILSTKKIISENIIKRDSLTIDEENYEVLLSELIKDEEKLKIEQKIHKDNVNKLKKYIEYKKERDVWKNYKSKILEYEEEEKFFLKKLTVSQSFKKKISEAESKAITQTIDNMNIFISQYLNIFFTDNPMTIEISPYKETKKDIKPVININIIYKGNEIDLDNLSGGEFDRVVLCFMLALNYIWGNDLLLLDESLSSLDSDLTNEILELLKSHPHFQNKLVILVAHQISEGNFDQIVMIE